MAPPLPQLGGRGLSNRLSSWRRETRQPRPQLTHSQWEGENSGGRGHDAAPPGLGAWFIAMWASFVVATPLLTLHGQMGVACDEVWDLWGGSGHIWMGVV